MPILVCHNYHLALDPYAVQEGKPFPPLGTLTVAATLRAAGHEVAVWDPTFHRDPHDVALALTGHAPRKVVLVADYHAVPQKMCLAAQRDAATTMIRVARAAGCEVLVSSPDASDRPEPYLDAGAVGVVRGDPDEAIVAWAADEPLEGLPGVQRHASDVVAPAPPRRDLHALPTPAWSYVDLRRYADHWRARHGYWEAPVSAARGCPYRCNWCAKPTWGRSLALRDPAGVVADARALAELGADRLWITDDIFAAKRSWLARFRAEVDRVGGILPFRCLTRADLATRDGYVDDLAASGCVEVWIGAESGSQQVLDAMDKDQRVEDIEAATARLHAHGIRVGFFLQLGYPGEALHDVRSTVSLVRRARPDHLGISVSYPLPGTPFYDRVKDEMRATNWDTAMDNAVLYEATYPQKFYDAAREVLRREHAVRAGLDAASRLVRRRPEPGDLRRAAAAPAHAVRLPVHHARLRWHARNHREVAP